MNDLYKIILVDDEDEVRGRISSKILTGSGFVVAGTAGNGYDALELIEKHNPHVVLTDIKMPYIDGIELAHIIRRDYPAIKIGFITGYDEFDYAREAIKLNVFTYLTKPLTQEDISDFLHTLKKELDAEIEEHYNHELIQKKYEASIPLIIENTFTSILASGSTEQKEDIEQLRQYGISLDDSDYILAVIYINRNPEHWNIFEFQKLKLSVRKRLSSLLEQESFPFYVCIFNDFLVFIIKKHGSNFTNELDLVLNRMTKTTELYLEVSIDIGVSETHCSFAELSNAYEQAQLALSCNRYNTVTRISWYNQFNDQDIIQIPYKESDSIKLQYLLKHAENEQLGKFLEELKQRSLSSASGNADMSLLMINIVSQLSMYASSAGMNLNEVSGVNIIDFIEKTRNIDQFFLWIEAIVQKLQECTIASRSNNAQKILEKAVSYVCEFYTEPDLTMEGVCNNLGISESYLSQLFKKYKETTFVKFLTGLRMEKAIELLVNTGDRIVEIANSCGYQDVYYFSHSFKKYTGSAPKKYREDHAS